MVKLYRYKWNSTPQIGLGFTLNDHLIIGLPFNFKLWTGITVPTKFGNWYYRKFSR